MPSPPAPQRGGGARRSQPWATGGANGSPESELRMSRSGSNGNLAGGSVRGGGAFPDDSPALRTEARPFELRGELAGRVIPATVIDELCRPSGTPRTSSVRAPAYGLVPHPLPARDAASAPRRAVTAVQRALCGADGSGHSSGFLHGLLSVSDPRHDSGARGAAQRHCARALVLR
jgi:hypothetical protein